MGKGISKMTIQKAPRYTTSMFAEMKRVIDKCEVDLRKFDHGNAAAGIRARKMLQEIRFKSKDIRDKIIEVRKLRQDAKNAES